MSFTLAIEPSKGKTCNNRLKGVLGMSSIIVVHGPMQDL